MKSKFLMAVIIFLIFAVLTISGCIYEKTGPSYTVISNEKTYNGSQISFKCPKNWTLINESSNFVLFNTTNGPVRVGINNPRYEDSDMQYFSDNGTMGSVPYYYTKNNDNQTYLVRRNGEDVSITGPFDETFGLQLIVGSFELV